MNVQPTFTATARNIAIAFRASAMPGGGLLTIHGARYEAEYLVVPTPTEFPGRAFLLAKAIGHPKHKPGDEAGYNVYLAEPGRGEHDTCSCPSHIARPNQPNGCKHIAAMRLVIAKGGFAPVKPSQPEPIEVPLEEVLARLTRVETEYFVRNEIPF